MHIFPYKLIISTQIFKIYTFFYHVIILLTYNINHIANRKYRKLCDRYLQYKSGLIMNFRDLEVTLRFFFNTNLCPPDIDVKF